MTDAASRHAHTPCTARQNRVRAKQGARGPSLSDDCTPPPATDRPRDDAALAEFRHRAANHFQMLVSLLDIYARRAVSQEARGVLADIRRNTVAMHLLYRRGTRYQGRAIEIDDYLRHQAEGWRALCGPRGIEIELQVPPTVLPVDQMTTLGLVADELVVNSIKHAFPHDRVGLIRVTFTADGTCGALTVSDNGVEPSEVPAPGGLGRDLLLALARQLRGSLDWTYDSGTTATLKFPYLPSSAD